MRRLRWWKALAAIVALGGGMGVACLGGEDTPSAEQREGRSLLLRDLLASRERLPSPEELEAQRRDLQAEVGGGEAPAQGGSGREQPTASITGTVEWVGDNELLFLDEGGEEREVRVEGDTRFLERGQEVSRRTVETGAQIRVGYDEEQGEWVARQVELLRRPPLPPLEAGPGEGALRR